MRWTWTAGRPALDFVNTGLPPGDRIADAADVVDWLVAAGLLETPAEPPRGLLEEARDLRAAIDRCVAAAVAGRRCHPGDVEQVDDWLIFAGARPALVLDRNGEALLSERPPADSPRRALGMVALDAARLLGVAGERERLRICASVDCGARFLDRSPAGRRRWCSMARCGNVAKARRHRARVAERREPATGAPEAGA